MVEGDADAGFEAGGADAGFEAGIAGAGDGGIGRFDNPEADWGRRFTGWGTTASSAVGLVLKTTSPSVV
ncbi:hypothetical protein ACQ86N_45200 [Puia sp. P3]|uniref:hypothetical protein n=1 Tax=Puia sp. P3 TaxID=3423952 RepID=UPI003D668AD8